MKALIADDEQDVRNCIQLLVNWKDYGVDEVYEVEDGQQAIRILRELDEPVLVLTDMKMRLTDGPELMDWIHKNNPQSRVIAISGYTDYHYVRQIFRQGGVDYLLKPIDPEKLHMALAQATSELRREAAQEEVPSGSAFEQLKDYIEHHYQEDLSVRQLSQKFHFSEAYTSRRFKELYGMSLIRFLKIVRIDAARKLLRYSDRRMAEIAEAVGYSDVKYFERVFREIEHMSPREWRSIARDT